MLISWAINSAFAAENTDCLKKGKIRFWNMGKQQTHTSSYCYNSQEFQIESQSCQDDGCEARKYKRVDFDQLYSERGSPGFKLCIEHYYSTPKIIEYWDGKNWIQTSICQFADDSYVDIGTLTMRSR